MITFNDFLQEALKPSVYRPMVKGWDKKRLDAIFKSSPLEKDRRAFRLFFQFPQRGNREVNPLVASALKDLGYEVDDYNAGLAIKNKQKIRIGKVLSKNPAALKAFVEDPARAGLKEYEGVISRHPYDIAAMSTDRRGWTSCQDLLAEPKHPQCEYVPKDIEAGTLVAYMIKVGDRNINNPVGRVLIKPYLNKKKETAYAMAIRSYGSAVTKEFLDEVEKFVDWLNRQTGVKGLFSLSTKVYQGKDAFPFISIGDTSESELIEYIKNNPWDIKKIKNPSEAVQIAAVMSDPTATVLGDIENPSEAVQIAAVTSNAEIILDIINPSEKVQAAAVTKKPFMIAHIKNPSEKIQLISVKDDPNIIQYIKDPTEKVQLDVVSRKPGVIQYIKNPTEKVQLKVIEINLNLIGYIKNPTEKVQLKVLEKNPEKIQYIKNPTPKAIQLANQLQGK